MIVRSNFVGTHPLGLEDLAELVEGDVLLPTQHVSHTLQLLGQVYLLLVPVTAQTVFVSLHVL